MPNEFDTNKNQLDLFSYAESKQNQQDKRQKLASSGFTATVWTLSGVVLAACSLFEDDEGLGGESVSVLASPVRDARIYFDIDGDGDVDENDVRLQNEQYPNGFITGEDGRAVGIPPELFGRKYTADLNGATDAATGQALEGQVRSLGIEGENLIASPITDLINERVAGGASVESAVAEILNIPSDPRMWSDEDAQLVNDIFSRDGYLRAEPDRPHAIALSKYLADNQIREVVGREDDLTTQIGEAQRIVGAVESGLAGSDAIVIVNEDDDASTADIVDVDITIGAHDRYVGIINAFSQDGSPLTYTLAGSADGTTPYDTDTGVYTINPRGGISVAEGQEAADETFWVIVSNGNPNVADQIVEVMVDVDFEVHELMLDEDASVAMTDENILSTATNPLVLIEGIGVTPAPGATVTDADFEIRDNALGAFANKFMMVQGGSANPTAWNLQLKADQWLDYEAIPLRDNGEIELDISVANTDGEHSNILTVTITVNDDPDDISFSGALMANLREDEDVQIDPASGANQLIAEGNEVTIANQIDANGNIMPVVVESDGVTDSNSDPDVTELVLMYGTFTYNHATNTWSYVVNNDLAAVQELKTGETLTEIVTLTIDEPGSSIIEHTRSITLNILGANEDVHYVDTITRNRVDGSDVSIEIGDPAINGMLDLGNVFDGLTIQNLLDPSTPPTVTFAETENADVLARQNLFTLTSDGALVFVGNDDDVANLLGQGIALDLVISAPDDTNEPIPFRLSINVVNEDDDGPAAYEIMGEVRENVALSVMRVSDDPDTLRGTETYQWFLGDESNPVALLGTGPTYTVTAADLASGETIGVAVSYTDGSGTTYDGVGGNPNPIYAFASPVSFTSPAIADRRIDLDEDTRSGSTAHFTVQAESEDDAGAPVGIASYELLDENRMVVSEYKGFTINSSTGVITLTGSLDYEMDEVITLRVRATDMNSPAETATLTLTVNVGDVNDNAPVFAQSLYTADIDETLGNGAEVARVSASDDDGTTANNTVGYSITAGNTNNVFDIDDNGVITVLDASELDFETTPSYTLTITATDNGSPAMMDTATVTITVNDVNDITPTYMVTAGENSASVRGTEAAGNSADVGTGYRITITDADTTNTFRGNFDVSDRRFDFVETSAGSGVWELTLLANEAVALSEASLTITYQVYDGTNTAAGGRGSVTVAVVDSTVTYTATQNAPLEIAEADGIDTTTLGTGGVLAQVTAESSEGQTITYTLTSATDNNGSDVASLFVVDSDDGEVRFANSTMNLDYEAVSEYSLVITASARQSATTTDTDDVPTTVIIRVINEQEGDGTYIIEGNVAAGGRLNAVVTDPDGTRSVTYEWYSLDSSGGDRQVIDTTQSITLPGAADFDDTRTYHVTITHTDNLGHTPGPMTLDASAVVFDIQKTDNTAFPSSIAENTDSLPVVVATLDGDTRSPTYTFVGGDTITTSGVFTISQSGSTAGAITVNAPSDINFETAQEFNDGSRGYTLNVRATFAEDTANNLPEVTGDVVVTIIVTDENEHAPVFVTNAQDPALSTGTVEIAEDAANGTRVGLFRATDADGSNNDVTYSLDDGGLGVFGIQAVDGTNNWEIYVLDNTRLDYDPTTTKPTPTRSYTIEITATDSDPDNAMSSAAEAFTINITDVNDNDPVLSATPVWEGTLDFGVPENTGTNVHLFTVSATDADENPSLTYEIVSIDGVALASIANPIFGIDASDGRVGLAGQLDRETKASHEIVIRAVDEGGRASNEETFTVTVGDVNDNKPVIPDQVFISTYASGVPESAGTVALFANEGVNPGVLLVNDDDLNQSFTYRIVSIDGVAHGDITNPIFAIQPTSGRFGLIGKLDYETAQSHSVVFEVTDQGGMVSEHKAVVINVLNEDDGPAVFEVSPTQANNDILEVEVDTADPDGLNGTYSYQWFTTTDDGVTQVDITNENGRRFDTSGRSDPAGTVYGVRVEYTDNAGTEYSQANGNAPFAVNTTLRFTESYSITLTDGDANPTLPVFADDLELNGDAITTGLEFTFATDGNPGNLFTLSSAGVLTFTGSAVDFDMATDAEKSFNLLIVAEATAGGETTTAIIPVTVEDVNDNDPTLSEPFDTASAASDPRTALSTDDIDENATGAATSISFEASDADTVFSGAGQTELEFTITATAGTTDAQDIADMFEMVYDSTNDIYTLRLKDGMALNAEAAGLTTNGGVQQIELRIQATDGRTDMPTATPTAGQGLSDARTVTITVNDLNDETPEFTRGATHTETIPESASAGATVLSANPATDGDATTARQSLTYSIVGPDHGFFTLDRSTGQITLTKPFDFESAPEIMDDTNTVIGRGYVITLEADAGDGLTASQEITFLINDTNEVPVLTLTSSATQNVAEAAGTTDGTRTGIKFTVADLDAGDETFTASDFTITDASDVVDPRFGVVADGAVTNGWEVVILDGQELDFEVADPADRTFEIKISVTDSGGPTSTNQNPSTLTSAAQTVEITVTDADDKSAEFGDFTWMDFATGTGDATRTVDENTTGILASIALTDPDTKPLSGLTVGFQSPSPTDANGNAIFTLVNSAGTAILAINAAAVLDFERDRSHSLVLEVSDGTNTPDTHAITIQVADVNEANPTVAITDIATTQQEGTVAAGGVNVASFSVTDADATEYLENIDVELSGDPDDRFEITGWDAAAKTGMIRLKAGAVLDHESDPTITLTITATDPLDNSVTDTDMVTINVGNINDNDPVLVAGSVAWESAFAGGAVAEADYGAGRKIAQITATDPDRATDTTFGELIYSLTTASTSGYATYFEITEGGELRVKGDVDFDTLTTKSFDLVVQVADATTGGRTDTHTYTVTIGNVNEHDPAFGADLVDFGTGFSNGIIPEDTAEGTVIGVVDVSDADGDVLTVTVLPSTGATQDLADKFEVVYNMMDDQYELKIKMGASFNLEGATPDPSTDFGLRLRATDGTTSVDSPADIGSLIVMRIGNVDDVAPEIGAFTWMPVATGTGDAARTVNENRDGILATIALTDPDTDAANLRVEIDQGSPVDSQNRPIFTFVKSLGSEAILSINTAADFDYEAAPEIRDNTNTVIGRGYTLTLVVADNAGLTRVDSHTVTINVAPVDEGDAVFEITSDNTDLSAPAVGDTLTVAQAATNGDDPDGNPVAPNTFSYKWFRYTDGADITVAANRTIIANEIGTTYELQGDDAGNRIGVLVEYTDAGGHTESLPFAAPLTADVASDFEVTGGTSGMADQYDASAVDATGTLMFGTASGMMVNAAGTYTIVTDGTYGTAEVVDGVWTYNVDNTNATIKALASGDTQTDTFTIGVPLTGGTTQNVEVEVTITGQTGSENRPATPSGQNTIDSASAPNTVTTFEVIQGGNDVDTIKVGSGGSLVLGGYGDDTITLSEADGVADTVVVRFRSDDTGGWRLSGGGDTITNFELGVDKLVLVDIDTTMDSQVDSFEKFVEQPTPNSVVGVGSIYFQYALTGTTFLGVNIGWTKIGGSTGPTESDGNKQTAVLEIRFKTPLDVLTVPDDKFFEGGYIDLTTSMGTPSLNVDNRLLNFDYVDDAFGSTDNFDGLEVIGSLADLGIEIL